MEAIALAEEPITTEPIEFLKDCRTHLRRYFNPSTRDGVASYLNWLLTDPDGHAALIVSWTAQGKIPPNPIPQTAEELFAYADAQN
jgi:hypothetical protein